MKNIHKRILTGISMIAGLILALVFREFLTVYIFDAVLLVILFFSVFEVMRATKTKDRGIKYHYVFAYLAFAYLTFFAGTIIKTPFGLLLHFIAQIIILLVFITYTFFMYYVDTAFIKQCKLKKLSIGAECRRIICGYLKVIGYPASFIYALFALNHFGSAAPTEINISLIAILLVFVISATTDTFAYIVGITLKGPKLCPKISPKKTWSGAVGGLFGGVLGSLTLLLIISSSPAIGDFFLTKGIDWIWALVLFGLIGLFGSVTVQVGDIFASFIKRKYGVKDYGKILPGHGGVMDRVDGNIFCAVFIFLVMSIICFIL